MAFRIADTHLHVVLAGDPATARLAAGHFARYAAASLHYRLKLPVAFEPARIRPIDTPMHLERSLRYLATQEQHHGTNFDPCHDGGSFPDVLGMRLVPHGEVALSRIRWLLPRVTKSTVQRWLGIDGLGSDGGDPRLLADAAAAALGVGDLMGRSPAQNVARRAAVHATTMGTSQLAKLLRLTARAVELLRHADCAPEIVRAVQLQWAWRTRVGLASRYPRLAGE
ncbi:MAG: hypothetical protein U0271_27340 [Polyangiaceae bacterium]